jgi:hypothetical protein
MLRASGRMNSILFCQPVSGERRHIGPGAMIVSPVATANGTPSKAKGDWFAKSSYLVTWR